MCKCLVLELLWKCHLWPKRYFFDLLSLPSQKQLLYALSVRLHLFRPSSTYLVSCPLLFVLLLLYYLSCPFFFLLPLHLIIQWQDSLLVFGDQNFVSLSLLNGWWLSAVGACGSIRCWINIIFQDFLLEERVFVCVDRIVRWNNSSVFKEWSKFLVGVYVLNFLKFVVYMPV